MNAAGYYAYQQQSTSSSTAPEQDSARRRSTFAESSTSSASRIDRILSPDSRRRVLINNQEEDDDGGNMSCSSTSSSSSSTILAPRRPSRDVPIAAASTQQSEEQQQATSSTSITSIANSDEQQRRCWICFGEDTDSEGNWVKPCKCSLLSHEQCLLDWIAESQKDAPLKKVHCPQCATPYQLTERKSLSLALLSLVDSFVHTAAPYITFLGLGCSMLITSTTYGAYTVLTLFGTREGERLIGSPATWTWRTWLGLPSIPVALIMSRSRWADGVLPFAVVLIMRATNNNNMAYHHPWLPSPAMTVGMLPWIRLFYNNLYLLAQHALSRKLLALRRNQQRQRGQHQQQQQQESTTEAMRILEQHGADVIGDRRWDERQRENRLAAEEEGEVNAMLRGRERGGLGVSVIGALLWPTISSIVGSCLDHFKLVRQYFPEPFHRNILGGCLFVVAKDVASLFYKYERIRQRQSRRVINYSEITKP